MSVSCVVLLSGGLDSQLAVRIMQEQGVGVEALNFQTMFTCCQDDAGQSARDLGVRLTVLNADDDYLDIVRRPQFGFGRGANPCVDCRIYMFEKAHRFMQQIGAQFIVSGEVVGQRPMSQKRNDLDVIARHSGLRDILLRPLSAKLQKPTLPEREGWVDRTKLYDFTGRSRKGLIQLAREFGFRDIPSPSTGCALTEKKFSNKVFDLVELDPVSQAWDFQLLKYGRHYRIDATCKVVVGRNQNDNAGIEFMFEQAPSERCALIRPDNFRGPATLVVGRIVEETIDAAASLVLRHSREFDPSNALVRVHQSNRDAMWIAHTDDLALQRKPVTAAHPAALS